MPEQQQAGSSAHLAAWPQPYVQRSVQDKKRYKRQMARFVKAVREYEARHPNKKPAPVTAPPETEPETEVTEVTEQEQEQEGQEDHNNDDDDDGIEDLLLSQKSVLLND